MDDSYTPWIITSGRSVNGRTPDSISTARDLHELPRQVHAPLGCAMDAEEASVGPFEHSRVFQRVMIWVKHMFHRQGRAIDHPLAFADNNAERKNNDSGGGGYCEKKSHTPTADSTAEPYSGASIDEQAVWNTAQAPRFSYRRVLGWRGRVATAPWRALDQRQQQEQQDPSSLH